MAALALSAAWASSTACQMFKWSTQRLLSAPPMRRSPISLWSNPHIPSSLTPAPAYACCICILAYLRAG